MLTKELCGFGIITHSCLRVLVLEKTSPVCYQEVEFTENITFLQYLASGYCSINKLVWFETKSQYYTTFQLVDLVFPGAIAFLQWDPCLLEAEPIFETQGCCPLAL